jgi:hypothetical protein
MHRRLLSVIIWVFQAHRRLGARLQSPKDGDDQLNRPANKVYVRDALTRVEGKLRTRGRASRAAWMTLGILAALVTGAVVVWQVLDHSEDPDVEPDKEPRAEHM